MREQYVILSERQERRIRLMLNNFGKKVTISELMNFSLEGKKTVRLLS